MMKKMMMLALALVMMLTLTGAALAESAPMSKEDQIDKVENDRVYEEHYQKTYDVETYIELLEKIGFKNIKLYSDFSKYDTECERVIFVCQKG